MQEGAGRYVRPIQPQELVDEDLKWLQKICNIAYYGYKPEHVVAGAITKDKQLWRLRGEGLEGLAVTILIEHPAGNELLVWGLAGRGYLRNFDRVLQDFKSYMGQHSIKWLTGLARKAEFGAEHERIGAKKIGSMYTLELKEET